jgi:hypothetical protein
VALLTLDGRPIAAQVLLYCGTTAYTWKTAFAAEFGKYSPGALLIERVTEQLFASSAIKEIESCSPEGGFMANIWSGRRSTVDLLLDLQPGTSLTFAATATAEQAYRRLKAWRNALRSGWGDPQLRMKQLAAQFAALLGLV